LSRIFRYERQPRDESAARPAVTSPAAAVGEKELQVEVVLGDGNIVDVEHGGPEASEEKGILGALPELYPSGGVRTTKVPRA
jgi:hypothetical protein